jgi:hypothetical protein
MNDDFQVKPNDDVYYKDRKVGSIAGNRLGYTVTGPDGVDIEYTLRREGELLYYHEVASKPGQPPVFGMVAIMKRDKADAARP